MIADLRHDLLGCSVLEGIDPIKFGLKGIIWHGLTRDEPFTAEGIIKAAFANPDRDKHNSDFKERF